MISEQTHSLYCPKCEKVVLIPYATEVSSRSCPECGAGAETLWPTEAMYLRDEQHKAREAEVAEAAKARAALPRFTVEPVPLPQVTHVALVPEEQADIPGVTVVEDFGNAEPAPKGFLERLEDKFRGEKE